jgi:thiol-disulfide isomerase/thioredoxin
VFTIPFIAAWLGVAAPQAGDGSSPQLPRYRLAIGQELRYEVLAGEWFDGPDGKPKVPRGPDGKPKYQRHDLTVFIPERNPDGSFPVVMKTQSATGQPLLTYADLFPDGRLTWYPAAMPALEYDSLRTVFPLLPQDERQYREGWQEVQQRTGIGMRYEAAGDEVRAAWDGPLDRVSGGGLRLRFRLDPQRGLPASIRQDGYWKSYKETHEELTTLKEVERHDAAWAERFAADARRYFRAAEQYRRLVGGNRVPLAVAARAPDGAAKVLDEAQSGLAAARQAVRESVFREDLDRLLKEAKDRREARLQQAERHAKLAGLPSPAWKAADLSGKEHALEQYRGQVVVLDFWFRQCSWCMRAMPQVEQAAETFRGQKAPVVFLAVSIDKDPADARHVADQLKLTYPVLQAKEVAERYGIQGYPTLLVIDPQGRVEGIFAGYSPTLAEELIACVRQALRK